MILLKMLTFLRSSCFLDSKQQFVRWDQRSRNYLQSFTIKLANLNLCIQVIFDLEEFCFANGSDDERLARSLLQRRNGCGANRKREEK